jgi:head-tail adaptor
LADSSASGGSPDPNAVRIGSLRWPVVIATRRQAPDPNGPGIIDVITECQRVRADIQPIGPMTFYAAAQVDTPITHRITIRWLDWVDTTHVVLRTTVRPDKSEMTERFRVRRVMPVDGRQRFLRMECELEERK